MAKRFFDLGLAVCILCLVSVPFCLIILWLIVKRELPIFYISERMTRDVRSFKLVKLRTMTPDIAGKHLSATGGDKTNRITPVGAFLRRYKLDEIPQLFNVIKGDMSVVGPRPPLRRYTDMRSDIYRQVLKVPAGITGLASIIYHAHETKLLANCTTSDETENIYIQRCIPKKARIDLIYIKHQSISLDLYVIYLTLAKFFPLPGRRAARVRRG